MVLTPNKTSHFGLIGLLILMAFTALGVITISTGVFAIVLAILLVLLFSGN